MSNQDAASRADELVATSPGTRWREGYSSINWYQWFGEGPDPALQNKNQRRPPQSKLSNELQYPDNNPPETSTQRPEYQDLDEGLQRATAADVDGDAISEVHQSSRSTSTEPVDGGDVDEPEIEVNPQAQETTEVTTKSLRIDTSLNDITDHPMEVDDEPSEEGLISKKPYTNPTAIDHNSIKNTPTHTGLASTSIVTSNLLGNTNEPPTPSLLGHIPRENAFGIRSSSTEDSNMSSNRNHNTATVPHSPADIGRSMDTDASSNVDLAGILSLTIQLADIKKQRASVYSEYSALKKFTTGRKGAQTDDKLQGDLRTKRRELEELNKKVKNTEQAYDQARKDYSLQTSSSDHLQVENEKLNQEIQSLRQVVNQQSTIVDEQRKLIDSQTTSIKDLWYAIAEMKKFNSTEYLSAAEHHETKNQVCQRINKIEEIANAQHEALQHAVDLTKTDRNDLELLKESVQGQTKQSITSAELTSTKTVLEASINSLRIDTAALDSRLSVTREEYSKLHNENAECIELLTTQMNELKEQNDSINKVNSERLNLFESNYNGLQNQVHEQKQLLVDFTDTTTNLRRLDEEFKANMLLAAGTTRDITTMRQDLKANQLLVANTTRNSTTIQDLDKLLQDTPKVVQQTNAQGGPQLDALSKRLHLVSEGVKQEIKRIEDAIHLKQAAQKAQLDGFMNTQRQIHGKVDAHSIHLASLTQRVESVTLEDYHQAQVQVMKKMLAPGQDAKTMVTAIQNKLDLLETSFQEKLKQMDVSMKQRVDPPAGIIATRPDNDTIVEQLQASTDFLDWLHTNVVDNLVEPLESRIQATTDNLRATSTALDVKQTQSQRDLNKITNQLSSLRVEQERIGKDLTSFKDGFEEAIEEQVKDLDEKFAGFGKKLEGIESLDRRVTKIERRTAARPVNTTFTAKDSSDRLSNSASPAGSANGFGSSLLGRKKRKLDDDGG